MTGRGRKPHGFYGEVCTVADCDRRHFAKGACSMHYQRMKNYGSYENPSGTPEDRFWRKVDVRGDDECWLWTGCTDGHGYGAIVINGKQFSTHRLSYTWAGGEIPEGLMLDHTCHNRDATCPGSKACAHRRCVNPAHMEPVTNQENQLRAVARFCKAVGGTEPLPSAAS